jgi:hypothetical protein
MRPMNNPTAFVEDAVVVFGDLAVLCRAGAESRRGRPPRCAMAATGLETAEIVAPGTLDGGDVLKIGSTVYVGASRAPTPTDRALTALLAPRGWQVVAVPSNASSTKSGVTALPDGTVVGFEPLVDDPAAFATFEAVPEEHGTAVVVLGPDEVLMSSDAPRPRPATRRVDCGSLRRPSPSSRSSRAASRACRCVSATERRVRLGPSQWLRIAQQNDRARGIRFCRRSPILCA